MLPMKKFTKSDGILYGSSYMTSGKDIVIEIIDETSGSQKFRKGRGVRKRHRRRAMEPFCMEF